MIIGFLTNREGRKSFLPEWPKATSGKNDYPSGNNFIPTQAIGQESYSYEF